MIGEIVSHYQVAERLGGGGMGVVYRAQDLSLGRHVALKFLPPDVTGDRLAVDRLKREARAAAALNHPNICAIYEIGAHQGQPFIAMELVVGKTLEEAIGAGSVEPESFASDLPPEVAMVVKDFRSDQQTAKAAQPLAVGTVIDLAAQLADALDSAHSEGVIHRDIKPSNIVLTPRGQAKILDFGLAKLTGHGSGLDDTRIDFSAAGSVSGTIMYMSPEQALGRKLDGRTDIFSLGAVLYEIATGRRAFAGGTAAAVFDAILNKDPEPARRHNPEVPVDLERIVDRALAKDRDKRYPSARDLLDDLDLLRNSRPEVRTGSTAVRAFPAWPIAMSSLNAGPRRAKERSIGVLPFLNMSSDPDSDYLGDGLAEELINAMTRVEGLRVASRTSAFRFRDRKSDIRSIGEALNVDTLLEGSVRRSGKRVRINAQLINVSDGYHLWSEQYDRELADIFDLQDDITRHIVDNLRDRFAPVISDVGVRRLTRDVEAYSLYLKGRYHLTQRSEESLLAAIECFEQAAARDPQYPLPHAGLAEAYILLNIDCPQLFCDRDPSQVVSQAVAAANAAIRLDDSSAEAHVALALVCYRLEWNWEAADREFRIALDLDEGLANAHHQYAMFLASVNRTDEAVGEIERAAELDPDSPIIATAVGRVLQFARRYDEAIEHAVRVTQTHKDYPAAYFDLALAHMEKGQFDEALEAFQKLGEVSRDRRRDLIGQAYVYSRKGDREKTLKVIRRLTRLAEGRPVPSVTLALVHLDLGDTDRAFELLEQGYAAHDSNLVYLQCEPSFDPLRSDPRFKDLLRRMNLEQYAARSTAS